MIFQTSNTDKALNEKILNSSAPFRLIPILLTWTKLLLTDVLNASWRNTWRNPDPKPNPNPHPKPNPNPNSDPNHNLNPNPNPDPNPNPIADPNPNPNPSPNPNHNPNPGIRQNGIRRNGKTPFKHQRNIVTPCLLKGHCGGGSYVFISSSATQPKC